MNAVDAAKRRLAFWKTMRWLPGVVWVANLLCFAGAKLLGHATGGWLDLPPAMHFANMAVVLACLLIVNRVGRAERLVQEAQEDALS
ncbi:MAG: hypothetical protein AB7T63_17420 [Planctomycetota bacterium]